MLLRHTITSCLIPLILACAAQPSALTETETEQPSAPDTVSVAAPATGGGPQDVAPVERESGEAPPTLDASVHRRLPDDSVYPLLSAEFALRQRDFQTAMTLYMEQAAKLRDPAVSAHATHLAQFLQREDVARDAVTLWVEIEPDNPEPHDTLATLLVREGRLLEAIPHLATVARDDESNSRFPIIMNGFNDVDSSEQQAIVEALDELREELPDSISLLMTRALVAGEMDDDERALARLGDVFDVDPTQHQALILEARILLDRNDDAPFARIERVLEEHPDRDRLRLQYARLLARDDMEGARRQFEVLSTNNPRDGDLLFSLALINEELGDPEAAREYLEDLLQLRQRNSEAYFVLGRIAENADEPTQAIEHYMQVGDGKDLLAATMRIGALLLEQSQQARFSGYFATLRQSYPARSEQLYALQANLLGEARLDDAGLALLNEALRTFPDSSSLRYARSVIYERRDNIDGAVADLSHVLSLEPQNATALNALGYTLANRTDRFDEAHELIAQALALQPNEPAILDSMGWVLFKQGDYDGAIDYLTRAYAAFPDPEVAAHLGEVMWENGDREGARNIWRGALEEDPEHSVLQETLERLQVDDLL